MAPLATLTSGCLENMLTGTDVDKPIVQILGSKKIASTEGSERYRLLVSDGDCLYSFAMLGTQLNNFVAEGKLTDNTIIRIDRYVTSLVNKNDSGADKKVLIILNLDVLNPGSEVGKKLGNPITLDLTKPKAQLSSSATVMPSSSNIVNTSIDVKPKLQNMAVESTSNLNSSMNTKLSHPITSLSPYQNKWVIKVRVTSKSPIRTWNNAKGEGKLFSMDFMDESGEIRCTLFRDAVDKFYDLFETDKVYYISKGQLKVANKQFTSIKNDYELTLNTDSIVQLCEEPVDSIPTLQYNLVPISQIENILPNTIIDLIGICRNASECISFTAKSTGRELRKREVTLVDTSNASVNLTLWGADADNFDGSIQPVILIKGARVTEFNGGKTVGLLSSAVMKINPDIPEGHKLRGWYDNGGADNITTSLSTRSNMMGSMSTEWMTFNETKFKNLGNGEKADYFQCKIVVHLVKTIGGIYKACAQADCNKKVIDLDNELYRCEKCSIESPNFKYRLLMQMNIGDWTSNRWVTSFSDTGEKLLGKTAQEIGELTNKDEQDAIFTNLHFKSFIFKLRTKVEYYGDSPRNKITIVSADPIVYKDYNKYLIQNLKELTGIGKN